MFEGRGPPGLFTVTKQRTVHNEKELAVALKQRADHIEILGSLAHSALEIKERGLVDSARIKSGNLDALNTLRVYNTTFIGGEILVVSRPGNGSPAYLPKVGTEAFDALNHRRVVLIDKDLAGTISNPEREELEVLEQLCGDAVEKAFPLRPVDLDGLVRLRDRLRAENEGHGS